MRPPATCTPGPSEPARAPLPRRRRVVTALASLTLTVLLAGCGAGTGGTADTRGPAPPGFPVTITNCGVTTTYQRPPQRVATMNQHATEIMLALGLEERMVGTAFLDDRILPEYREEYRRIPVLAEQYPSYEVLLKTAPDFVYGGFDSAFSAQEGRSRKRLRQAGINTYLNVANCTDGPVTMKQVRRELHTVARIFGVPERSGKLIGEMNARLAAARRELDGVEPTSVFVYDSGTKAPMTAGGYGIANEIIRLAGGRNIFAGLNKGFVDVSWEQVIQRRPEVILILDYGATSVAQKKRTLLHKPGLANVPAIKHRRFAVLPLSSLVAGVRAPRAVGKLVRQLYPGRFQ